MKLMGMNPEDGTSAAHDGDIDFAGKSLFEAVSRNKVCLIILNHFMEFFLVS